MVRRPLRQLLLFGASLALGSAIVLAVGLGSARAQTTDWTHGKTNSRPTVSDMIPAMSSDEAYTERYGFAVDLDGGGHIGADWTISNLGWGDGHGGVAVRVRLPGKNDYDHKAKVAKDEWKYSDKKFDIDIDDTRVRARGKRSFVVTHEGDKVSFRLVFTNTTPMWKPGGGQIKVKNGYFKFNMLAPRATVQGHVTIDGKKIKVKGTESGYADHVATNIAPFDFAKRFSRFRTYNGDVFVMWREVKLHPNYGGRSLTWVVVGYKDKIVFSDADAQLRFARLKKDPKSGYKFPLAIQIDGKDGKDSIKLVMRGRKFKRTDLLASYGAAAKTIASSVSNPYRYDVKCRYTLKMTIQGATAKVSGRSHFVLDYINK